MPGWRDCLSGYKQHTGCIYLFTKKTNFIYMAHTYFKCTIKYDKVLDEGRVAKVTEQHLVDALSFTEAEARIIKEMEPFISGEFAVVGVVRARINETFFNVFGAYNYFVKVAFESFDERTQMTKFTPATMLVQANDIEDALRVFKEGMKGSMADYKIVSITETPIIEIYKYNGDMSGIASPDPSTGGEKDAVIEK